MAGSARAHDRGVRSIALFEASKGLLVLLVGFELLHLVHRDLQALAEEIVRWGHLNPARRYPRIFLDFAAHTSDARLRLLAALAFLYASARLIEAYGLWYRYRWAEWLAIVSGAAYLPLEVVEIVRRVTPLRAAALAVNAGVVAYLLAVERARSAAGDRHAPSPPDDRHDSGAASNVSNSTSMKSVRMPPNPA